MKVTIEYNDNDSFTMEEVVKQAIHNYGKSVVVDVAPDSSKPHDLIYFGIQQVMTHRQLSLLFDDKLGYAKSLQALRNEVLNKLTEILDQVIIDNEDKVQ
jgi:hypothetical protein